MQIYGAYTRGIQGHLFTVSATPNAAGRLHVAGVRGTAAQHTAATVDAALKRFGMCNVGTDVRLEPAGAGDPPWKPAGTRARSTCRSPWPCSA